ncbi:MAG: glycosyltransferase family 1 protein, partial [Chloroflexota bacterium]|nr:glycosyltransferase family 1 protein [Chloroflexota bacterium]
MRLALVYDAIYPWVTGGAERRFAELGRRLATRHDVHLVGWQWWDGPARIRRDGMTLHGLGRGPALYGDDGKRTVREALAFSARLLP